MRRVAASWVLITATVASCGMWGTDPSRTWFEVANRTDQRLKIVYDRHTGMTLARDVPPGAKVNVENPGEPACTEFDVIALNEAGAEIARREPPVCGGDVWTIPSDAP